MGRFFLFLKFAVFVSFIFFVAHQNTLATEDNLLENPGFEEVSENKPLNWSFYPSTATMSVNMDSPHSGLYAVSLNKVNSTTGSIYIFQDVSVQQGQTYKLGGYVLKNESNFDWILFRVEWKDKDGNKIGQDETSKIEANKEEYQFTEGEFLSPDGVEIAKIMAVAHVQAANPQNPVYFDDLFFALAPSITPTPSPSPSPSPSPTIDPTPTPYTGGGISLNEFMPNPSEGEEWVEIKNENDFEVSLEDWSIDDIADGGSSPVEFSSTISAKDLFVVYIGTRLNNSGDTVRLIGQGGEEIETYPYASSRKGYSFAKDADGNWQETSDPTPGEENSIVGFSTPQPEAGRPLDGTPTPVPTATPTLEPDSVLGLSSKPSTSSANTATDSGYLVDLMCPLIEELETKFQIQKNDNLGQNTGGEEKKDINETRPHVRYVLLLGLAAAVGSFGSLLKETSFLVKWWHELFSKV